MFSIVIVICLYFGGALQVVLDGSSETMAPLFTFIDTMADDLQIDGVTEQFRTLKSVLHAKSGLPTQTKNFIDEVRAATASAEFNVLASFEGLQQGKRLLEQAETVMEERMKTHSHLEKISLIEEDTFALKNSVKASSCESCHVDTVMKVKTSIEEARKDISNDQEASRRLDAAEDTLFDIIDDRFVAGHLADEIKPWFQSADCSLAGSHSLPGLPAFHIRKLEGMFDKCRKLHGVFEFCDVVPIVAKMTLDIKEKRAKPTSVCSTMKTWDSAFRVFIRRFPDAESLLIPITCKIASLVEDCYVTELSAMLKLASGIIETVAVSGCDKLDLSQVRDSLAKCDEGQLIATGLSDPDRKRQACMMTKLVKGLLSSFAAQIRKESCSQVLSTVTQILNALGFAFSDLVTTKEPVTLDMTDVHSKILVAYPFLSAEHSSLQINMFEKIVVTCLKFISISCFILTLLML